MSEGEDRQLTEGGVKGTVQCRGRGIHLADVRDPGALLFLALHVISRLSEPRLQRIDLLARHHGPPKCIEGDDLALAPQLRLGI